MIRSLPILLLLLSTAFPARAGEPNILFILADDLGWADLGCYGSELFETPNLDQLAGEGLRFTQAYAPAPICSASRAAIQTGNSTARNQFEFVVKDEVGFQPMITPLRAPPFTIDLKLETTTIPEALAATGRPTAFFGKWHLNAHHKRYLGWSPTHGPLSQGFQTAVEDFGSHPYSYWSNKDARSLIDYPEGEFPTDSMTNRAIDFIESDHKSPFFLMVSHFYVHDPNHTRIRWLFDHYLSKFPAEQKNRETLAHYGAMVTTLDHHVGKLLKALDAAGKKESTLVVFTSDNGGHPNYAGNAPLRGSKWNLYEGGIRVPMIARFPGTTKPDTVCDNPVWSIDLFSTFAELTGADASTAKDGRSILPLLVDPQAEQPPRQLIWHFPYYHPEKKYWKVPDEIGINDGLTSKTKPHSAIRSGKWKLLHFYENDLDELYNLDSDLNESDDLAKKEPKITKQLRADLDAYLKNANARFPTPHPDYSAKSQ